jgi:hypothetical protein
VHVAKRGNARGPALITFHDLGLNHISNFQVKSLSLKNNYLFILF